jgi:hypothetical protein
MTDFNLELALKGEHVVCENGFPVRIAGVNKDSGVREDERLIGWVFHKFFKQWVIKSWTIHGIHSLNRPAPEGFNLKML